MIREAWKDPVWSKVIAAGIIAVLGIGATYFAGLWPKIGILFSHVWNFFTGKTPLYNWLIIILSIPFIIIFIVIIAYLKDLIFGKNESADSLKFREYNSDIFYTLKWRWKVGSDGLPYDVTPFCPKCDYQIIPQFASAFRVAPRYEFKCEDCGFDGGSFEGEYDELEQKVKLKIQKNLRTGKWKEKINAQPGSAVNR